LEPAFPACGDLSHAAIIVTARSIIMKFNILCMADYITQETRLCNILCVLFAFHLRIRPPFRHILSSLFKEICEQVLREKSKLSLSGREL